MRVTSSKRCLRISTIPFNQFDLPKLDVRKSARDIIPPYAIDIFDKRIFLFDLTRLVACKKAREIVYMLQYANEILDRENISLIR